MDMHVKLTVHMSNMDKWKRPSRVINSKGNLIPFRPSFSSAINTDFLYTDVYKKVDANRNTWQISVFNTGVGIIGGILTENNTPISNCMLYLYQSSTGVLAKRTISKEDGSFMFTGIVADITYFVVGVHKSKKFNSVILDEVRIDSLGKDV
jgi:hypothetical protein